MFEHKLLHVFLFALEVSCYKMKYKLHLIPYEEFVYLLKQAWMTFARGDFPSLFPPGTAGCRGSAPLVPRFYLLLGIVGHDVRRYWEGAGKSRKMPENRRMSWKTLACCGEIDRKPL